MNNLINPVSVILSFGLILLLLALFKPHAGRIVFGVFFLVMAWGVNLPMMLVAPSSYPAAGAHSILPLYRWFFSEVLARNPLPFILLLIAFETMVGLLTLTRGRWVKLGLGSGAVFCLAVAWIGKEGICVPALAIPPLLMLRYDFPQPVGVLKRVGFLRVLKKS